MINRTKPSFLDPDKPEKIVTLKPRMWDRVDRPQPTFTLKPCLHGKDEWEVFLPDGTWIGHVERYTGSIDTVSGRIRHPGKQRTLWAHRAPGNSLHMWEQVSRADCLRSLLNTHERRSRA